MKEADRLLASSQACMRDIPACKWLDQWTELAQKYDTSPPTLSVWLTPAQEAE